MGGRISCTTLCTVTGLRYRSGSRRIHQACGACGLTKGKRDRQRSSNKDQDEKSSHLNNLLRPIQRPVQTAILIGVEYLLAMIAALGDVIGDARNDDASTAGQKPGKPGDGNLVETW